MLISFLFRPSRTDNHALLDSHSPRAQGSNGLQNIRRSPSYRDLVERRSPGSPGQQSHFPSRWGQIHSVDKKRSKERLWNLYLQGHQRARPRRIAHTAFRHVK